jgi:hypothetical protein
MGKIKPLIFADFERWLPTKPDFKLKSFLKLSLMLNTMDKLVYIPPLMAAGSLSSCIPA